MKLKGLLIASILFLIKTNFLFSQQSFKNQLFQKRTYFKPMVSEISSTLNKVSVIAASGFKKDNKDLGKILSEVHLGAEFPIYSYKGSKSSFSIFVPVSLHVLWATFEPKTAPIVNNDYRFGFSLAYLKPLTSNYLKNVSIKAIPFAHESTHLGDEITIAGLEFDQFYRINVSYEYYELAITLNDPDTLKGNLFTIRAGLMGLINPIKGYYSWSDVETQGKDIFPTERWAEYYLQLQYRNTTAFYSSARMQFVWSFEARNRIRYDYLIDKSESYFWCFNNYFGYNYSPNGNEGQPTFGSFFVLYRGLNFNGQLRNSRLNYVGYSMVVYI